MCTCNFQREGVCECVNASLCAASASICLYVYGINEVPLMALGPFTGKYEEIKRQIEQKNVANA